MMTFGVYSIRDVRTGFLSPTVEVNDDVAIRNFTHAVMNGASLLHSFPGEYDLYKVAEFDSDTAAFVPLVPIQFLLSASSIILNNKKE